MPRFYSSTNNCSYTNKKNLADHNNENNMCEEAFVVQVTQHWKLKTSDQQQSINNQYSQPFIDPHPFTQSKNMNTISNLSNENLSSYTDKNSNKDGLSTIIDESEKSTIKIKERNIPIRNSHRRRRPNLNNTTRLNESSNSQLYTNSNKTKFIETKKPIKKNEKTLPIFIPPKTSSTQSHIFSSTFAFDNSLQTKQKSVNKRQNTFTNNNSSSPTNWTSTSPTSSVHYHMQSLSNLNDENSADDNLFIQKTKHKLKDQQTHSSFPTCFNSPLAIFITDPSGHSHRFNPNTDILEKHNSREEFFDEDLIPTDTNTLGPNSVFDVSSSSEVIIIPSEPLKILDKHRLHSIGEEEDEDGEDEEESDHDSSNVFSKELDRIETLGRSYQINFNPTNKDNNEIQHGTDKELLGRRLSDGNSDEEKERIPSIESSMKKTSSAISITKSTENLPVKLSLTKYVLMKLHLISSNKDNDSNISSSIINPQKKRTVRRSTDKKHSRTNLSIINDSKSKPNIYIHGSSNSLVSNESVQEQNLTTDTIQSPNNSDRFSNSSNNKRTLGDRFGSVGNLDKIDSDDDDDDDIDGKFENAKLGLPNRAASCMDMRGSQSSINSEISEKKAHYGLSISGTIELKLTYSTVTGALDILICNCKNLTPAKKNKTADPYVKVYLLPDRSKNSKRKTSTQKNTTDPVFDEKLRYHLTKQEFETRVLWISVWNQGALGQNDFLGEIHISLSSCTLDKIQEHKLVAQKQKNDLTPNIEPTVKSPEIQFQLTFIENPNHKEVGTLQVHYIEGRAIFNGRRSVDAICKGVLMPDHVKRKLPAIRKGPIPKWEIPLRWDGIRRKNLENSSVEISIWSQERFRKTMIGFVRLNLARGHFDNKSVQWSDATKAEKSAWETFLRRPTDTHHFRLPLRGVNTEDK